MRGQLDGPLAAGANKAGQAIESALARAIRTGKFGFDDLKRVALATMSEIASAAVRSGIGAVLGTAGAAVSGSGNSGSGGLIGIGGQLLGAVGSGSGGSSGSSGLIGIGTQLLGAALGLPGRATGGAVAPGRSYLVGERGPELFVPTTSGRVEAGGSSSMDGTRRTGGRDVRVAITLNATGGEPQALARSGRQVARAVRSALEMAER